jgi:agmatinase
MDGLDIVAYDMVEVLPQYDPSQATALLAANIVYEFLSLIALAKKRRSSA